jgi:homopolymeric O-antigen transport system ATP-binding protein
MTRSEEIVVRARGLSKTYRIFDHPADRLRQMLVGTRRTYFSDFRALHDVSFELRRGEALGIIGRNGHGKSTLLQLLAGTLQPSSGIVESNGRIGALLELGAGFNPDFTGRENVLFTGMLVGMARAQIIARLDDVVAFAEIGEFIDRPVKMYSTGMFVRLAFAVQIFTDPDILIVDEALAVGDIFFQQKCFARIREMRERGMTLIFVSHDMAAVRNVCDRALLLNRGCVEFEGPPDEAVSRYHNVARPTAAVEGGVGDSHGRPRRVPAEIHSELIHHNILGRARARHGAGGMAIVAASFENELGEHGFTVEMQHPARITMLLRAATAVAAPSVGLHLFDRLNNLVFASGSRQLGIALPGLAPGDELVVSLTLGMSVQPGHYTFNLGCSEPSPEGPNYGVNLDRHEGLGPIVVHADTSRLLPFYGMAQLPLSITTHALSATPSAAERG